MIFTYNAISATQCDVMLEECLVQSLWFLHPMQYDKIQMIQLTRFISNDGVFFYLADIKEKFRLHQGSYIHLNRRCRATSNSDSVLLLFRIDRLNLVSECLKWEGVWVFPTGIRPFQSARRRRFVDKLDSSDSTLWRWLRGGGRSFPAIRKTNPTLISRHV